MTDDDIKIAIGILARTVTELYDMMPLPRDGLEYRSNIMISLARVYRLIGCQPKNVALMTRTPYYLADDGCVRSTEGDDVLGRVKYNKGTEKYSALVRFDGLERCTAFCSDIDECAFKVYQGWKAVQ